jgi:hypothetical protein
MGALQLPRRHLFELLTFNVTTLVWGFHTEFNTSLHHGQIVGLWTILTFLPKSEACLSIR